MLFPYVAVNGDPAGEPLVRELLAYCRQNGWHCLCPEERPQNYVRGVPFVVDHVKQGAAGVLICGSGLGMSMAANRIPHIRAALCYDTITARLSRQHNHANILVLGARLLDPVLAMECLSIFLSTPFEGGRHQDRIESMETFTLAQTKSVSE